MLNIFVNWLNTYGGFDILKDLSKELITYFNLIKTEILSFIVHKILNLISCLKVININYKGEGKLRTDTKFELTT